MTTITDTRLCCPECKRLTSTTNLDCARCRIHCTCDAWSRWVGMTPAMRRRNAIHRSSCPISPDGCGLKTDAIIAAGY